jgi:hypothetical protein
VKYRPYLPIVLSANDRYIHLPYALVDTGSDVSVLPIAIARELGVPLDDTDGIVVGGASGESFTAYPSHKPVRYTIMAEGYRPVSWEGTIYFANEGPAILLGHHQCLERFDLTFHGPERTLSVLPRFRG